MENECELLLQVVLTTSWHRLHIWQRLANIRASSIWWIALRFATVVCAHNAQYWAHTSRSDSHSAHSNSMLNDPPVQTSHLQVRR